MLAAAAEIARLQMCALPKAKDARMSLTAPVYTDRFPDLPSSVEWLENMAHHASQSSQSSLDQGNQASVERGFEASEAAHEQASHAADAAPSDVPRPISGGAEPAGPAPQSAGDEEEQPEAAMDLDSPEWGAEQEQLDAQEVPAGDEDMPSLTHAPVPSATPAKLGATEETRQMDADEPTTPAGDPVEKVPFLLAGCSRAEFSTSLLLPSHGRPWSCSSHFNSTSAVYGALGKRSLQYGQLLLFAANK